MKKLFVSTLMCLLFLCSCSGSPMTSEAFLSLKKGTVSLNEEGNVHFDISTDADDERLIQFHVNGKLIEEKYEGKKFIYEMSPGDYRVSITCEGYSPWERTVTVVGEGEAQQFVVELAMKD